MSELEAAHVLHEIKAIIAYGATPKTPMPIDSVSVIQKARLKGIREEEARAALNALEQQEAIVRQSEGGFRLAHRGGG